MRIDYDKIIGYVFENLCNTKNIKGTINECLIAGNLSKYGYEVLVNNDRNPEYDILLKRNGIEYLLECKLDNQVSRFGNFFFEYWNYTYGRKTGINNNDLNTLYSHTYYCKEDNKWYCLIAKRMTFVKTIQKILAIEPDKIKQYNNVYYSSDGIKGDAAYIINKDTFIKYFKGYNIILIPAYRWK